MRDLMIRIIVGILHCNDGKFDFEVKHKVNDVVAFIIKDWDYQEDELIIYVYCDQLEQKKVEITRSSELFEPDTKSILVDWKKLDWHLFVEGVKFEVKRIVSEWFKLIKEYQEMQNNGKIKTNT